MRKLHLLGPALVALSVAIPTVTSPDDSQGLDAPLEAVSPDQHAPVESVPGAANAWKTWQEHGTCDPEFFTTSLANVESSDYLHWYNDEIASLKHQYPQEFNEFGEVALFGEKTANEFDFKCSTMTDSCDTIPPCDSVLRFVVSQGYEGEAAVVRTRGIRLKHEPYKRNPEVSCHPSCRSTHFHNRQS